MVVVKPAAQNRRDWKDEIMEKRQTRITTAAIDGLDKAIAEVAGPVTEKYEQAYQEQWRVLTMRRQGEKEMEKAGRALAARVRKVFRRVLGDSVVWGSLSGIDFVPSDAYVIAHGENPCRKRPHLTGTFWIHRPYLRMEVRIPMGSGQEIVDSAFRVLRAIETYLEA